MSTEIETFYRPIRHVLGDMDASVRMYEDEALEAGIQTIIQLGEVAGFELTEDQMSITPSLTAANDFALLVYKVAQSFAAPHAEGESIRTRSFSGREGSRKGFLFHLEMKIHEIENGELVWSWQSFGSWLRGVSGVRLADFVDLEGMGIEVV